MLTNVFVKLTLCCKSKTNGPDKIWRLSMLEVMCRNMTWNVIFQASSKKVVISPFVFCDGYYVFK